MHHRYWLGNLSGQYHGKKSPESWFDVSGKHQIVAGLGTHVVGHAGATGIFTIIKGFEKRHVSSVPTPQTKAFFTNTRRHLSHT